MLLCHKLKALILEAPCAYFRSALCLFWKRMVFLVKLHACVLS